MNFTRRPEPGPEVKEFSLPVDAAVISGLLAEPDDPEDTRAVLVAIHGAGMHAGYFDARTAPGLSLLDLGRRHGYTVWAVDRPGIGASAGLPDERITLSGQADLLLDAMDEFARRRPVGAGFLLVGHSYGLKVAWTMAARPRGRRLVGVDGSGSGVRYAFEWGNRDTERRRAGPGDRGDMWGPDFLYPAGTFDRDRLPLHDMPPVQVSEGGRWPADIRSMGHLIAAPLRLTFGEYERLWPIDRLSLDEIRAVLTGTPSLAIEIEQHAGHNLSLGWAALPYHLKVLSFAESCILGRRFAA